MALFATRGYAVIPQHAFSLVAKHAYSSLAWLLVVFSLSFNQYILTAVTNLHRFCPSSHMLVSIASWL